jgi:TatD DNase family protein
LATELERPVSVHCRRAWGRLMELLDDHGWPPRGVLLHSYSGGPGLVAALVHRGAWFSFSGAITHDKNLRGRDAVIAVPEDRLLVETDAPDLMPNLVAPPDASPLVPEVRHFFHRHHSDPINEPANLPIITAAIASLRKWTPDHATQITRQNAETFFGP